jgi:hypothetical protein
MGRPFMRVNRMGIETTEHPADRLALALSRASGIVASVAHCFSDKSEDFAVSSAFIAHALKTVENFITEASTSLTELDLEFDLSTPRSLGQGQSVSGVQDAVSTLVPQDELGTYEDDASARFKDDGTARTYDELLAKVTAAEVFATSKSEASSARENDLIPLLNSLKADLLRLRSVA